LHHVILYLGKVPGKPKILTDTRIRNYNQKYHLKFKGVKDPPGTVGKVLYYLLRYTDVTTSQGEWRSEVVAVKNNGGVHQMILDKLDWGRKYKLELYAGNRYGLGAPSLRTLETPKGWSSFLHVLVAYKVFLVSSCSNTRSIRDDPYYTLGRTT
jgi:hypothetical protein